MEENAFPELSPRAYAKREISKVYVGAEEEGVVDVGEKISGEK